MELDLQRDKEYFQELWEYRRPNGPTHTATKWNERAKDWGKDIESGSLWGRMIEERVSAAADYLRKRGLLGPESNVVDVGCGPGLFVCEFAKTAGHATGVDLSDKMLAYGARYAAKAGRDNVSFHVCDFLSADLDALGWTGKFDLVFTSITPAISKSGGLDKVIRMSRGYCFNSCFIHKGDSLQEQIAHQVFGGEVAPAWDGRWFYSLFNLLWLDGYCPETYYHRQSGTEELPLTEELARQYTSSLPHLAVNPEQDVQRVFAYLKRIASPRGTVSLEVKNWYGWVLWDTRIKSGRLAGKEERG